MNKLIDFALFRSIRGPKVDQFFRNFSGWTEPIHWVLDRNFRKFWLNGSRPMVQPFQNQFPIILQATSGCAPTKELCQNPILYLRHVFDVYNFVLREGTRQFFHHPTSNLLKLTKPSWIDKNYARATRSNLPAISFPEAAILLVSDGDRDLWPDGILSPQIADFRLHCAESKVKPKMAERSGPDTFLEGVKFGLEKVGKANITLKQKQKEILKIIALTQKDVLAVLPTGYGKSKKDWHSAH